MNHEKLIAKKIVPANHPVKNARFKERRSHAQNRAPAPSGANQASPNFGNANASATAPSIATANSNARAEVPMLRKLIFVVSAMALTLASCGRQVTPDRTTDPNGLPSGFMQIKFNTAQQMDFTNVWYVLALNTSGTGGQPYAINGNPAQNWLNFSFEIIVYQPQGSSQVQALVYQFISQPSPGGGSAKVPYGPFVINPQQLQLIPNCNGSGTQFCLTIDRTVFQGVLATPSPTPTTTPSATPSPTASPSGSPSPTSSPSAPPFGGTWSINWFTVNPGGGAVTAGRVIDAPGTGGATDVSWLPPSQTYNTTTTFDLPWTTPAGWPQVSNQAAQIAGGEVLNSP